MDRANTGKRLIKTTLTGWYTNNAEIVCSWQVTDGVKRVTQDFSEFKALVSYGFRRYQMRLIFIHDDAHSFDEMTCVLA